MNGLSSISPAGLTLLAVLIGFILIASLDNDESNVLGNWLIGIGGLLIIASSQGDYISSLDKEKSRHNMLKKQIDLLREEIGAISGHRFPNCTNGTSNSISNK